MKYLPRNWSVWLSTAVLCLIVGQLAWAAARLPRNPEYLIGNWQVVAIGAVLTVFFFFKPRIGRWYVVPFFVWTGLLGVLQLARSESLSTGLLIAGLSVLRLYLAFALCRLPRISQVTNRAATS